MKAGDIFEHPVKDTEDTVMLIAVGGYTCANCIFRGHEFSVNTDCESDYIGKRHRDVTGSCSTDDVVYQLYKQEKS